LVQARYIVLTKVMPSSQFRNWTCLIFSSIVLSRNVGLDKTIQSQIYWGHTENCLNLSPIQFTPPTRTRQDSLVRVDDVH